MTEPTPKRYRTRDDMLGGLRRQIMALPAYAADTAEIGLEDFTELAQLVEDARAQLVVRLVVDQGWTWGQVGRELGITRQSARERWGKHVAAVQVSA